MFWTSARLHAYHNTLAVSCVTLQSCCDLILRRITSGFSWRHQARTYIRLSLTKYDSNLLSNMRSFFLSFSLVGNFLTYKFLRFCFDLNVRTFRFGSSKTSNSSSVDKPRQEPINAERATRLCPCNGVFIDQFIYRSIFPRILTIK